MKKNYFMLAAATMMLAACAETDLVNEVNVVETPQTIGFETFAGKTTRAEITKADDLKGENVGFQVWGYKYPNAASNIVWVDDPETANVNEVNYYPVFNGVDVTWNTNKWTYEDTQYWDRTSKYNFYAVAPKDGSYSISNGMISITDAESAKSTESKDYLIDRDGNVGVDGAYTGTDHAAVDLDFHHVMSKLSFQLKAAVPEEITINSLTMSGWNANKGNFTQKLTTKPSSAADITEWSIPEASTAGSIELVGGTNASDTDGSIKLNADMSTISKVTDEYIMVPQAIDAETLTFTISFTIDGEKFNNQVGKLKTIQTWGTDAHITYTISVGPDVIDFNVTNVCGFDAGSAGPNLEIE